MHYRNGREAKNGDRIFKLGDYYPPVAGILYEGILYDAVAGNNDCNGRIALTSPNDPIADLKNCLHADDIAKATIIDSTREIPDTATGTTCNPGELGRLYAQLNAYQRKFGPLD